MKIFIAVLVLVFSFQSWTKAEDISEFEIEGIAIGDSLLDYFSEDKINSSISTGVFENIRDKTFTISEIESNDFNTYERVQFIFKKSDKKYKIYGIHGVFWIRNDMNKCMRKLNEISSDINSTINFVENYEFENLDLGNNLGVYSSEVYKLKDGYISIHCYNWTSQTETEKNWVDNLRVNIKTNEYEEFLNKD